MLTQGTLVISYRLVWWHWFRGIGGTGFVALDGLVALHNGRRTIYLFLYFRYLGSRTRTAIKPAMADDATRVLQRT